MKYKHQFLKFVKDDNVYYKYYDAFYILFHTGLRISEFCGLTINDIDLDNRIINIDHQLQRTSKMEYIIDSTKTKAGTRKIPMTEDVYETFRRILKERPRDLPEKMVDGYIGFLFRDKNGMPEVAMHWQHRFNHAVKRYNDIFKIQMLNITPHVCRHTYCSNQARAGMNPKTLQYLMGHSEIGVTMRMQLLKPVCVGILQNRLKKPLRNTIQRLQIGLMKAKIITEKQFSVFLYGH